MARTKTRATLIEELIEFTRPVNEILEELHRYSWDSDELCVLGISELANVLQRYIDGELNASEVEQWADAVECRDDIAMSNQNKNMIWQLANPELNEPLTKDFAVQLLGFMKSMDT